ncbi:putative carbohydrate kinase PfkB, ribokinase [Helianthus annuus]|nr:putative carbohydrate kinase PfkB, ribokinase [Helianthus annuus]
MTRSSGSGQVWVRLKFSGLGRVEPANPTRLAPISSIYFRGLIPAATCRELICKQKGPFMFKWKFSWVKLSFCSLLPISCTWTGAPTVPSALVSMLLRLPKVKFVIVTLGADGCIMLQRSVEGSVQAEEIDADDLVEKLKCQSDSSTATPSCVSSDVTRLHAKGVGTVCGKLFLGTAEKIPQSELVDTTGAGDAFIGAVLYGICTNKPPEQMLPFAAQVAAIACRDLGARAGLPRLTDPRLAPLS